MSRFRIFSLIILLIAVFISIDLGCNYLQAVTSEISGIGDGIAIHGITAPIILGDRGWSYQKYLSVFETSVWIAFIILVENAVLSIFSQKRKIKSLEAK